MPPLYVKENGQWSRDNNNYYSFKIKFKRMEDWQNLIIKTTNNDKSLIKCSLNFGEDISADNNSWAKQLLLALNKKSVNLSTPRNFILREEKGNYCYDLIEPSKKERPKERLIKISKHDSSKSISLHKFWQPQKINVQTEPRTKPFASLARTAENSLSSFFGLEILLNHEKSDTCCPPQCLTISLEVIGGFIFFLGIAAVAVAFTLLTGVATPVTIGFGAALILLGLGFLYTGLVRQFDCESLLNDEPDYYKPPQ
ncbi:MAG: hypothetical protein H0U70_02985 [Tatlockia sp.]|nr:hypothetical protein [Tatlockia sp.]